MRDEPTMTCGPPKMPLSSMVAAMKTEAAAISSRGLAAAFVVMAASVLSLREALQLRTTPAAQNDAGFDRQRGRSRQNHDDVNGLLLPLQKPDMDVADSNGKLELPAFHCCQAIGGLMNFRKSSSLLTNKNALYSRCCRAFVCNPSNL